MSLASLNTPRMQKKNSFRNCWIEIDCDTILYNLQQMRNRAPSGRKMYAVLKADAYGFGDIKISELLIQNGVYGISVATFDEALKLRRGGIQAPVLVMGYSKPKDAILAAELSISLTVFQPEWVREVKKLNLSKDVKIHLKVDSGMCRVGVKTIEQMY